MKNYFRQLAKNQAGVENFYIPKTEKASRILRMVERCNKLAEMHLVWLTVKRTPKHIVDYHELEYKRYMETGARLIQYYNKL